MASTFLTNIKIVTQIYTDLTIYLPFLTYVT